MASHLALTISSQGAIQSSLANNENTDLVIECHDRMQNFRVHKAVVLPQWRFMMNACKKHWEKEKDCNDGKVTYVELPDDSAVAVDAAIEFFYSGCYSSGNKNSIGKIFALKSDHVKAAWQMSEIRCHIQVYILADKYGLDELGIYAKDSIYRELKPTKYLAELHDVIRDVYKNTSPNDRLRAVVAQLVSKNANEEFALPDEKLGNLIVELPEFGRDLAERLCERINILKHAAVLLMS